MDPSYKLKAGRYITLLLVLQYNTYNRDVYVASWLPDFIVTATITGAGERGRECGVEYKRELKLSQSFG